MRLATFIIALLLLAGSVDPTKGWLIALVVFAALAVARPFRRGLLDLRPNLEIARVATLTLAALLLAGTIDPTRDWLIALTAVAGVSAFMPGLLGGGSRWDDLRPWPSARECTRGHDRGRDRFDREWAWDWGDDWR